MEGITLTHTRRREAHDMYAFHVHDEYEIYYMIKGKRRFIIDTGEYEIGDGDVVIISPEIQHKSVHIPNYVSYECMTIYVSREIISAIFGTRGEALDKTCAHMPHMHADAVGDLLSQIEREYNSGDRYSDIAVRCLVTELMIAVLRDGSQAVPEPECTDDAISRALAFIAVNYSRPITLYDAAEYTGLSANWFSKKFKAVTGVGFKEYIIKLRIERASAMLLSTNMSVADIAYSCGFESSNYFGDAFKRIKGIAPGKFRKRAAEEK